VIRTALVGLGWWGRHIAGCLSQPGSKLRLSRAVDLRAAELRELAAALSVPISASLDDVLRDPGIDAVILATPHSLHEAQIVACASAGKHVFCEKPLTLNAPSAKRALAACAAAGVVLGVGHERRFEPAIAAIRQMVDDGELGTLMHLEANFSHDLLAKLDPNDWRADPAESPIPALSAMAIHLTDAYIHLCGPVAEVFAYSTRRVGNWGSGDVLTLQLRFVSGLTGSLSTILVTPMYVRFQVFGSAAWVEARSDVHPGQPGSTTLTLSGATQSVRHLDYVDTVRVNLDAFADAVAGTAPYPISPLEQHGNIAVVDAVIESAHSGKPAAVAPPLGSLRP
jgi:predicted dehydrogenase